jgi:hypothetical protein
MREGDKGVSEEDLIKALTEYLESDRASEKKTAVQRILYRLAGQHDILREKIDRVHGVDYTALLLLEQIFSDKDQLRQMLAQAVTQLPRELLAGKGRKNEIRNAKSIAQGVKNVWATNNSREERIAMLGRMLKFYRAEEIETKLLSRTDLDDDVKGAMRYVSQDAPELQAHTVVTDILSEPADLIRNEKAKYEYRDTGAVSVSLRAVKGPCYGLYGLSAGVCIATDIQLWKKPEFKLLAVIASDPASQGDGNGTEEVVGYVHVFEAVIDGKRYITLPGINPSAEFMGTVDAEKLYRNVVDMVVEFAKVGGYAGVYIPTNPNIHSNRIDIQKEIKRSNYVLKKIPEVKWNTLPSPYIFSEVFVVWER